MTKLLVFPVSLWPWITRTSDNSNIFHGSFDFDLTRFDCTFFIVNCLFFHHLNAWYFISHIHYCCDTVDFQWQIYIKLTAMLLVQNNIRFELLDRTLQFTLLASLLLFFLLPHGYLFYSVIKTGTRVAVSQKHWKYINTIDLSL